MKTKTWVVLSDIQIPFQDHKALSLVHEFIADLKPYGVILNGDVTDCYSISDFDKNPLQRSGLQKEIHQARKLMEGLESISQKIWLGGNHEDRLRRYIWKKAKELGDLEDLTFSALFHTKEHGFSYYPYGASYMLGKLMVTHGFMVRKDSGNSGRAHFDRLGTSVLIGHTHRLGAVYFTNVRGQHGAFENGCLCRLDPEYAQRPNWQQGFSVVDVMEGGLFNVHQIPILNRRFIAYGKETWDFYSPSSRRTYAPK